MKPEQIIDVKISQWLRNLNVQQANAASRALSIEAYTYGFLYNVQTQHISNGEKSANYIKTTSVTPIILLVAEACRIQCSVAKLPFVNTSCTCALNSIYLRLQYINYELADISFCKLKFVSKR